MPKQPLLKLSASPLGENKDFPFSEAPGAEGWATVEWTPEELIDHIYKGKPVNACLFLNGKRGSENSFGGNTVILDLDDGEPFDKVVATPIVQRYAALVYHSASSGCVSNKPDVDGRERLRVVFCLQDEAETDRFTEDLGVLHSNVKIQHLQRCALNDFFAGQLCEQLGIPRLKDNSHKSISQMMYGNSGKGMITPKNYSPYPCSTDRRIWIGRGFLPTEDIQRITDAYRTRKAEDLELFTGKTNEERSKDALVAHWIFDNDILDEQVYKNRDAWKYVMFAAKSIDEELLDVVLKSGERFDDGHDWRTARETERVFNQAYTNSRTTVATIIHWANICCPEWRSLCPHTGGMVNPPPPISAGMYLLKGISATSIII